MNAARAFRNIGRAGLLLLAVLALRFGADAGITIDERNHVDYGERVLAWYGSGFRDRSAMDDEVLALYGGLFDAPAQWLAHHSPLGIYETRHVLTSLIAVLGLVATWKIAALFYGPPAGFFAAALLALTPAWLGHGLFNPKDTPFATAATFAMLACLRVVVSPFGLTRRRVLQAGTAIGMALGVRAGGVFLAGYLLLAVALTAALSGGSWWRHWSQPARRTAATLALTWLWMLSAWPWAQLSPLLRPLMSGAKAGHFSHHNPLQLFGGVLVHARDRASYLPTWFAMTLPELYFLAAALGLYTLCTQPLGRNARRNAAFGLLCFGIVFPPSVAIILRSVLYDAQRHVLFVLPLMAAVAGCALARFFQRFHEHRLFKTLAAAALSFLALLTAADMIRLHPYEYVYFNRLSGGLSAAEGRFDTDYWGASYREGLDWLVHHHAQPPSAKPRIGWCSKWVPLDYYLASWSDAADSFELTPDKEDADYYLARPHSLCRKPQGQLVHEVSRDGVALLQIWQVAR